MYLSNTAGQFLGFGPLISVADGSVITGVPATIGLAGKRKIDDGTEAPLDAGSTFSQNATNSPAYGVSLAAVDTNGANVTYTFTTTTPVAYPIVMTVSFWDTTALEALADAVLSRDTATVQGTMPQHCLGVLIHGLTKWTIRGSTLVILNTVTGADLYVIPLDVGSSSLGVITGVDSGA